MGLRLSARDEGTPTEEPTDAELIRASLEDPAAFGAIFDRHFDKIYAYLRRRFGAEWAEDLASETFTRAIAARDRFDGSYADAAPWLYGIALNVGRRHGRDSKRDASLVAGSHP